jgi:hypothetical protein
LALGPPLRDSTRPSAPASPFLSHLSSTIVSLSGLVQSSNFSYIDFFLIWLEKRSGGSIAK